MSDEPEQTIPAGHLEFEFQYDRHITPRDIHFNCYKPNRDKLFGIKMDIDDWRKFAKMISRWDSRLQNQIEVLEGIAEVIDGGEI